MSDTQRTLTALQTLLADNTVGAISPQDLRDLLVSALGGYTNISLQDGATPQTIGTTPAVLSGFTTDGAASGCTPLHSSNVITVLVAGDYEVRFAASFSGTASRTPQFRLRKGGVEVSGVGGRVKLNASGDVTSLAFSGQLTCAANDQLTVYAEADVDSTSLTLVDANFSVKRLS
jgi:hypothetical protein